MGISSVPGDCRRISSHRPVSRDGDPAELPEPVYLSCLNGKINYQPTLIGEYLSLIGEYLSCLV